MIPANSSGTVILVNLIATKQLYGVELKKVQCVQFAMENKYHMTHV